MSKLRKYKIEIELCGPEGATHEDVFEYVSALVRESDLAAINDIFAVGEIEVIDEGDITVEQWNGDPIDEVDVEDLI